MRITSINIQNLVIRVDTHVYMLLRESFNAQSEKGRNRLAANNIESRLYSLVFDLLFFRNYSLAKSLNYTHKSRIYKMEKMKINSKTRYNRNRVINAQGPHMMLKMIHQKLLTKIAKEEAIEKDTD